MKKRNGIMIEIPKNMFRDDQDPIVIGNVYNCDDTGFICSCHPDEIQEKTAVIMDWPYPIERKICFCKYCKKVDSTYGSHIDLPFHGYYHESLDGKFRKDTGYVPVIYVMPISEYNMMLYVGKKRMYVKNPQDHYHSVKEINVGEEKEVTYYANIKCGEQIQFYKSLKRNDKKIDAWTALNINSKNVSEREVYYEGAKDFWDFYDQHIDFMRKIGFDQVLSLPNRACDPNAMFINYIALMASYPVVEQLIKMHSYGLYNTIYHKMETARTYKDIKEFASSLSKLINQTTKGSKAFRIPKYISDYLGERNASIDTYLHWCDIFELEPLSKENFEEIVKSKEFISTITSTNRALEKIPDIMKYGIKLKQVLKYNYEHLTGMFSDALYVWKDYLTMCETMNVTPDLMPQHLRKQHDDIAKAFKLKESELERAKMQEIGDAIEECFNEDKKFFSEFKKDYVILAPKNANDFIDEGNKQHNCVGSYYQRALEKQLAIFFIRKKDKPDESFVTAECRSNGTVGQVMYKNNQWVYDKDILKACETMCKKIKSKVF